MGIKQRSEGLLRAESLGGTDGGEDLFGEGTTVSDVFEGSLGVFDEALEREDTVSSTSSHILWWSLLTISA